MRRCRVLACASIRQSVRLLRSVAARRSPFALYSLSIRSFFSSPLALFSRPIRFPFALLFLPLQEVNGLLRLRFSNSVPDLRSRRRCNGLAGRGCGPSSKSCCIRRASKASVSSRGTAASRSAPREASSPAENRRARHSQNSDHAKD